MNDQNSSGTLPELPPETIDRIESAVFAQIASERSSGAQGVAVSRRRTRRRRWLTGAGIAAAFVIGVLVTPPILSTVGGSGSLSASDSAVSSDSSGGSVAESDAGSPDKGAVVGPESAVGTDVDETDREIITTAHATLQVKDIAEAAADIAALSEDSGGYVENTEIGGSVAVDGSAERVPVDSAYGWISVRIPSAALPEVMAQLEESGEVLTSSISRQDVTSTAIDLRARIDATRASVQRLTELMSQSGSLADLIEAEVALTDRQAQLESYEQQLAALEDQVAMSTLQVDLTRSAAPTTADPAGFADGLLAGWNGLVVALNALVIAVGFLLPWLALAGVVALIIWLIRRARKARNAQADQG